MKVKFYECLIVVGFIIWLAETAYFGFNVKPINNIEYFFDVFSVSLIFVGVVLGISEKILEKPPINIRINIDQSFIDYIKKINK